jgi:hypothetical protein
MGTVPIQPNCKAAAAFPCPQAAARSYGPKLQRDRSLGFSTDCLCPS